MKPRKPVNKIGKKGLRNIEVNRQLKINAIEIGLPDLCELQYEGCTKTIYLTWAHSRRRDLWRDWNDAMNAARACVHCHTTAQNKGNAKNEQIILAAIAKRETAFYEAA